MPWPWQKGGLLPLNRRWQTLRARAPKPTLRVGGGALILAFALVVVLSKPLPFVVDTTDYAIVTAFGKPTQVITSPGLGFRGAYESSHIGSSAVRVRLPPPAEFLTLEKNPSDRRWHRVVARGRSAQVLRDRVRPHWRRIQAR